MQNKFLLLVLFILSNIHAQQISITIDGLKGGSATLNSLKGEKVEFIDSLEIFKGKEISYNNDELAHGFYRVIFQDEKQRPAWIDFVYDGKDITLSTSGNAVLDSMKVINSESNRLFYEFLKLNKAYKTKEELLQLVLARYPSDDEYYTTTQERLNALQNVYIEFVYNYSQKDPNSFVARYIRSSQLPIVNYVLPPYEQLEELKKCALDNVDFRDEELINSDCFTNKSIEYLTYYRNPQLPKDILEKEFMIAVDTLLTKASVNSVVYQHVAEYLIDGFKKFGFDLVIDYILGNYVIKDDLCLNEELELSIEKRIKQSKLLTEGSKAPDIALPDIQGNTIPLKDIKAEKTLVVFYSSQCPHCKEMLPKLKKIYESFDRNSFEVMAVSLDEKKEDWSGFVKEKSLNWFNVSDLKGWITKPARDYYIYATPSMFLLDREKKIIAKPVSLEELLNYL